MASQPLASRFDDQHAAEAVGSEKQDVIIMVGDAESTGFKIRKQLVQQVFTALLELSGFGTEDEVMSGSLFMRFIMRAIEMLRQYERECSIRLIQNERDLGLDSIYMRPNHSFTQTYLEAVSHACSLFLLEDEALEDASVSNHRDFRNYSKLQCQEAISRACSLILHEYKALRLASGSELNGFNEVVRRMMPMPHYLFHSLEQALLLEDDEALQRLLAKWAADSPVESAIAEFGIDFDPSRFRTVKDFDPSRFAPSRFRTVTDFDPSRFRTVGIGFASFIQQMGADAKKAGGRLALWSVAAYNAIPDCDLELARVNMLVISAAVTAFAALKAQDTEDKIKPPLAPLIGGFGLSFYLSFLAAVLGQCCPKIAKASEKLGTITTAVTFSVLVYGLMGL